MRDYGERLEHLHIKDVSVERRDAGSDFWSAVADGVFCPAGDGLLDLGSLASALDDVSYSGYCHDRAGPPRRALRGRRSRTCAAASPACVRAASAISPHPDDARPVANAEAEPVSLMSTSR